MYLFFTFTGDGGGLIGERERASATCGRWWYFEGRGGCWDLSGDIRGGVSFFFFLFFFVGRRLVRENGNDIGFFVQNRDLLYREVGSKRRRRR